MLEVLMIEHERAKKKVMKNVTAGNSLD